MTIEAERSTETAPVELVTLTIDDVEVSVPKGTLLIRAAELIGVDIPRFCDHPLLEPVGACRQCLVEVTDAGNGRGFPKPQASCTLEVAPGMVAKTQVTSPTADKAQVGTMEFLLINHPLDCPVCDKGGECPLQNQAMSHGRGETRFTEVKRTFPKPTRVSAQVLLDRERCVLCARCTRFSEQIAGDPFITMLERGPEQQVGVADDVPFHSYFSGNTIQICPVGALTSADYRFRSRPFDLVSTPSVAEHDACGSAIRVDHRRGKVMRRLAGDDPEVNEEWITDKDRFCFTWSTQDDRLRHPLVRNESGELEPASWPAALAIAARGLSAAHGGVGVLPGGRLTAEDAFAYSVFARAVLRTNDIDFRARVHSAEEADFLAAHVAATHLAVTYRDLEEASTVVLVGLEPEDEAGTIFLRLRKASLAGLRVVSIAAHATRGLTKMGGELVATVPGQEAAALDDLTVEGDVVVLVGERLAAAPGAFSAALRLAERSGAKVAWVPRRAGDRGAVETGCLPTLLPGGRPVADAEARADLAAAWGVDSLPARAGRDTSAIIEDAASHKLGALLVGGVEVDDLPDPARAREALQTAFVVSLEVRESDVTRDADVVLPVAPVVAKPGMFVTWEGPPAPVRGRAERAQLAHRHPRPGRHRRRDGIRPGVPVDRDGSCGDDRHRPVGRRPHGGPTPRCAGSGPAGQGFGRARDVAPDDRRRPRPGRPAEVPRHGSPDRAARQRRDARVGRGPARRPGHDRHGRRQRHVHRRGRRASRWRRLGAGQQRHEPAPDRCRSRQRGPPRGGRR